MKHVLLCLAIVAITASFAQNLVVNGDFEQALTTGWTQYSANSSGGITRSTTYDPDPDYEAYVYRIGSTSTASGYEDLYQIVDIPSTNLQFHANLKLYAYDNGSPWCAACLVLKYLNSSNAVLGQTRIYAYSGGCPWTNTSTLHLIGVSDSLWHTYSFNINDELANLPGVNPGQIAKIRVALFDTAYCC